MRICYTWVAEDDASDQTKERSTCLAQGNQGQRGQVEILQRALKKAHMKNKQKKKQLETTVNHGKSKASSEGTNAIRSLFPFRLLPMCRRLSQPVNGLEDWRREDIQVHASFLHWRLQAWGSDEVLPLNQVQSFHYYPGLDTDL